MVKYKKMMLKIIKHHFIFELHHWKKKKKCEKENDLKVLNWKENYIENTILKEYVFVIKNSVATLKYYSNKKRSFV